MYLFTLILVPLVDDRFGGSTLTLAVVNSALPAGVMLSGPLPWRSQAASGRCAWWRCPWPRSWPRSCCCV
ncbi:hypothetical protein LT493_20700 [Streptomyces tricolor]|nr:hypothetical protein [Streptomyces tricolor]